MYASGYGLRYVGKKIEFHRVTFLAALERGGKGPGANNVSDQQTLLRGRMT